MNATCKWNYDGLEQRLLPELYASFGVPDLAGRLPGRILPVGAAVERITAAAAEHLGLRGRSLLAQGGIDSHTGILGADTVDPGKLLMIGGTLAVHPFHLPVERPMPGSWGPYPHALIPDLWMVEGGQVSAGSVLSWLSNDIFQLDGDGTRRLIAEAAERPVGGTGLPTLDYSMGRTPYRDPYLRGAVLGLSLGHDRAALYRSAAEGVALASANVVAQADGLGVPIERIVFFGGYCKNALWLQAAVDAIGLPVELAAEENLTIVGCAAAAATGAGLFDDLHGGARAVARPGRQVDPDPAAHALYAEALERYRGITALLADTLHDLCDDRTVRQPAILPPPAREPHFRAQ